MINLPCPPHDWPRFTTLLDNAMDLPETNRAAWLESLSGDDARLKPWLARVFGATPSLDTQDLLALPATQASGFCAGRHVGPYRLVSLLGEGGMGEVWRASRSDDGPRREVALKLPHAAYLGGALQRRFVRERDVLAALSHPHVAQLYDAGISADGHPYLALELVPGQPITEAMRARGASLDQRVDLVRQMLAGLGYAHQRLIVHRDIKPANVLVTPDGDVKLLDFGIAKLLGAETGPDPALTGMVRLATPAYAAPEQLRGGTITVTADIFSVGVVLYELCTGRRPFVRVPSGADAAPAPLASRCVDTQSLGIMDARAPGRALHGDLDAIIARALSLDEAARYPSADAFDDDLRRWRQGLPVRARHPGWPDLAAKFVRRHRLGAALAAVLAVSLAGGTAGIAWQAQRAETEAARAEQEAHRATAVKDFMIDVFEAGDPLNGGHRSDQTTVRDVLDSAVVRSEKSFSGDPATEVALLDSLANIFASLDEDARSEQLLSRRLDIARRHFGAADPQTLQAAFVVATTNTYLKNFARAEKVLAPIRQPILSAYGPRSIFYAQWLNAHASVLQAAHGVREQAIAELTEAADIFAHAGSLDQKAASDYLSVLNLLVNRQSEAEQYRQCLATLDTAGAVARQLDHGEGLARLQVLYARAQCLEYSGDFAGAERDFVTVQTEGERLAGPRTVWVTSTLLRRARMADLQGDRLRAAALLRQAGASAASSPGTAHNQFMAVMVRDGRGAEVIPALERSVADLRQAPQREDLLRYQESFLGEAYDQVGAAERARAMLLAARDDWVAYGVAGTRSVLEAEERWGRFLLDHQDPASATPEFQAVLAQSGARPSSTAALATAGLARVALATGQIRQADALSGQAVRRLDADTREYDVRDRIIIWSARAEALLASGDAAAAKVWADRSVHAADVCCDPGSRYALRTRVLLERSVAAQKQP